jgi:ligand-binding SRPBCC domain-containing protein
VFEISPKIMIDAPTDVVWNYLIDVDNWWLQSNPEHIGLEIQSDEQAIRQGTRMLIRERIAGIPGEALGEISEFDEHEKLTWKSNQATYRVLGVHFSVKEGVTWELEPLNHGTQLSAHVWAYFPDGLPGMMLEWWFKHVMDGISKDYQHAMTELRFVKAHIEERVNTP